MRLNRGYIALFACLFLWGSTFAITKIVLRDMGPLQLTCIRFVVAFAILTPLAYRQGFRIQQIIQPKFLLFGLTGIALFYGLQNAGLKFTSITSTVLIQSSIPAITAILAAWILKEKISLLQVLGIGLVTIGVVLVALSTGQDSASPAPVLGNLLVFGSALAWSVYTIQGRLLTSKQPALLITTAALGSGLIFLIPLFVWETANVGLPHLSMAGFLGMLYLGIVASGLTLFLWNYAISCLPASVATPYINLEPVIGIGSAVLMGETIPIIQIFGGLLAILGVWLSSKVGKTSTTVEISTAKE
jgi:drug/metabolite transporter (DMT)-like permease